MTTRPALCQRCLRLRWIGAGLLAVGVSVLLLPADAAMASRALNVLGLLAFVGAIRRWHA